MNTVYSGPTIEELQQEITHLQQQNEEYRRLASFPQLNPDPVLEFDLHGQVVYQNPAADAVVLKEGAKDGRAFLPPDFEELFSTISNLPASQVSRQVIIDDLIFDEAIYYSREYDSIRIYATDITEQMKTQQALKESEARFRMVLKHAPVTVAAQDRDLHFIWAYNQKTVNPADVIGKTDTEIFPPDTASWLIQLKQQVLETGRELRTQGWVTSGGQRLFLDIYFEPIRDEMGQVIGVGAATVDLTGVKQAEQAVIESEARYHSLFTGMTEGFAFQELIFDADGKPYDYRFLDINPAFEHLTGLKQEDVIGKTYREVLPDEGNAWFDICSKVVLTGIPVQLEYSSPSLGKHYEIYAYRVSDNRFAVIFMDITSRKEIENVLRINLTKYSVLFDSLPLGVTVSDRDGQILESNQEAINLLGLSDEEQRARKIDGQQWQIIRPDGTLMPSEEFASVRALKEQQRIENVEMGIVKSDGQVTWISVTASPLPLENYGVVIAYNNITRRFEAEEALRKMLDELEVKVEKRTQEISTTNQALQSEIDERIRIESELIVQTRAVEVQRKRFNDVLEILPAYIILLTPDYHVAFSNQYFRDRFGEDHGRRCYEYLFGLDAPCENCETYKTLKLGKELNWEWTGPDGHNYDVHDFPFNDVDGSTLILEMGIDITMRKRADEALRLSNAYNRNLLEADLDPLLTITPDGKIGDVNTATEIVTGCTRTELIGTDFFSYFTDPEKARKGYQQVFDSGKVQDYELEIQHKNGHITPVLYNATVFKDESGKIAGIFAAARDITERKQAEKQLVLLYKALESAANGIIVADKKGKIVWSNTAFSQITGYEKGELIGRNPRLLNSGRQDQRFYENLWGTILDGRVWRGELINRKKDGTYYTEDQTITPVIDEDGTIENFISIKQDVTEHKKFEAALIKSEELYRSLVIATAQIVWQTDEKGDVVEDNPMWRNLTGQTKEELLYRGWLNAIHPEDREQVTKVWQEAVEAKSQYNTECRIRSSTGEYFDYSLRGVPIKDKKDKVISWIGTCTDMTEKKRFEAQLIQAEKHAVIGRMVGSVTHEINNPLQTIKNCLYLLQQDTSSNSTNYEPLGMAISETQRLSNIVGQLRQLYRTQTGQIMQPHCLKKIIQEVHSLLTPHLNNSMVTWRQLNEVGDCKISCVREQLIEVFLNISMNAIEAMQPAGGVLAIDMVCSTEKGEVGIVLIDSGPGIAPEILPHIFEPFTTTKEFGLGLGLSICYGIIQKHGGQISVESQPGDGTKFIIWLPIAKETNGEDN